jgi:hypothetical protein
MFFYISAVFKKIQQSAATLLSLSQSDQRCRAEEKWDKMVATRPHTRNLMVPLWQTYLVCPSGRAETLLFGLTNKRGFSQVFGLHRGNALALHVGVRWRTGGVLSLYVEQNHTFYQYLPNIDRLQHLTHYCNRPVGGGGGGQRNW